MNEYYVVYFDGMWALSNSAFPLAEAHAKKRSLRLEGFTAYVVNERMAWDIVGTANVNYLEQCINETGEVEVII